MIPVLNKTSIWKRHRWNTRLKSSERFLWDVLTSSSSCSITETLPSPVGPTSFSRSLFSGCRIIQHGHFHHHKYCCPTCVNSTLKANASSPRLSSESQGQASVSKCMHVCPWVRVCDVWQPATQINPANVKLAGLWNLVLGKALYLGTLFYTY